MFYKNTKEIHVHPHYFIHSLYTHHIRTGVFNLLRTEEYRCKKLWDTEHMKTLNQEIILFVLKTLALVSGIILVALIYDICTVYGMYTR